MYRYIYIYTYTYYIYYACVYICFTPVRENEDKSAELRRALLTVVVYREFRSEATDLNMWLSIVMVVPQARWMVYPLVICYSSLLKMAH